VAHPGLSAIGAISLPDSSRSIFRPRSLSDGAAAAVRRSGIGPFCGLWGTRGSCVWAEPGHGNLARHVDGNRWRNGARCSVGRDPHRVSTGPLCRDKLADLVSALVGSAIVVIANMLQLASSMAALVVVGAALCFGLRVMAIKHGWRLQVAGADRRRSRGTDTAADPQPPEDGR
jgi:hypothetical protein